MSDTLIAKMSCWEAKPNDFGGKYITLSAVVNDSEENKCFATATPTAHLNMTIDNPSALDFFVEGKEYYLEFREAFNS